MEYLSHSVVHVFGLGYTVLEPVVPVLVYILDQQGVEGVDISCQQLPLLLQLTLNLSEAGEEIKKKL